MKGWIKQHPLAAYFCLAYAISWSIAVPLALQAQGILASRLPSTLHYLTAFGPAVAAVFVAWLIRDGSHASASPARRSLAQWIGWGAVGFGSPLLLFVVALIAARAVGQPVPAWRSLGQINFLPDLGLAAWALWFLTSGCGEEFGWRGFALPRLQRTHSAMTSSLLLAAGWAGWHLPFFFYIPSYAALGLRIVPGFLVGILAGAIVLTWLYNRSGGNVIAAALWHASFNLVTASPNAAGFVAAVTSSLVIAWALILVWRYDWDTLATRTGGARSVRASKAERTCVLPGDGRIPQAVDTLTHGVTIRAAPRDVWPWLVQMGAGRRAGWYSYDALDNGRQPSATRIIPELQHPATGSIFPALPGVTDGFTLLAIEPERTQKTITLGWPAPDGTLNVTWTFVLNESAPGVTRLLVRVRGGAGYRFHGLPLPLTKLAIRVVHFIMQRKQLLGIARRAEVALSRTSPFKTREGEAAFLAEYDAALKSWPVPHQELDIPTPFGMTHVVVSGPTGAPPLVLLHGYMATLTMWAPNVGDFSRDYRVYAVDVMGQPSKSIPDAPVRSAADYVTWLTATLAALHLDRVSLAGMSYGGWLALNYALAVPERVEALALLSPAASFLPLIRQFMVRGMLTSFFPTPRTVRWFIRWLGFPEERLDVFDLMYLGLKHFRVPPETLRVAPTVFSDEELRALRVPTLLLIGEREIIYDPTAALARARRLIPDLRGVLMPASSHDMCFTQRAGVDTRVLQFLSESRRTIPERSVA